MREVKLRIPDDLHAALKAKADADQRSINIYLQRLIERDVRADQDRADSPRP